MPPFENSEGDLYLVNENGEAVKFHSFTEIPKVEVEVDPQIKKLLVHMKKFAIAETIGNIKIVQN